jgi:hypothetical protein
VLRGTSERATTRGVRRLAIAAAVFLLAPASGQAARDVKIVSGPAAWTNARSASFGLSSAEPGGIECRLDAHIRPRADWARCEDGHKVPGPLPEGRHVLEVRTAGGPSAPEDSWTWRVDVTPPSVPRVFEPTRRWHLEKHVTASWGATDSYSGIFAYDVRYDVWSAGGSASMNVPWLETATVTGATFRARTGRTYCLRVGVQDRARNPAPALSPPRCFARPLDDRALGRRGLWSRRTGVDGYLGSSYIETTRQGAFARTTVFAKRLLLVATRCPRCGVVEVRWRGRLVKTVDLSAAKRTKSARIPLVSLPTLERGTVRIDVASTDLRIRIDGVGASAV